MGTERTKLVLENFIFNMFQGITEEEKMQQHFQEIFWELHFFEIETTKLFSNKPIWEIREYDGVRKVANGLI